MAYACSKSNNHKNGKEEIREIKIQKLLLTKNDSQHKQTVHICMSADALTSIFDLFILNVSLLRFNSTSKVKHFSIIFIKIYSYWRYEMWIYLIAS